jgi:hypothetical protein
VNLLKEAEDSGLSNPVDYRDAILSHILVHRTVSDSHRPAIQPKVEEWKEKTFLINGLIIARIFIHRLFHGVSRDEQRRFFELSHSDDRTVRAGLDAVDRLRI